ncbi:maleylpyruvate isomerase N-terminal domain-containing protein [Actinoplanes sp. LDG1-06]|uniref:Maleylpyruvate isomerase N-terminal domain-containing protein n=1 Tax=Paractinoplanes ovalisporus TaxID=2810368 RepID=A0ABS2AX86_9ACTN|nr:maleylpyruvate isomerase N-terminal domain-containing protein [Actinoplanes ovalisporus]MBM2623779.1 maleylpyruvate isomerase N-terminal domain-containing protein [Actinoplanes ovalisporus]
MTTFAAGTIAALRTEHDALAALLDKLTPEQLEGPSGASDWTVAQVFSHLGSGAEIALAGFQAHIGEGEKPGPDFNPGVWDRWNAKSPEAQAADWRESDEAFVAALEALTPEQHETITVNPGFLPEPVPLASFAGLRLNEVANHTWDIRAGLDPQAGLLPGSAALLVEHLSGGLAFLIGFIGKPDLAGDAAVVEVSGTPYRIVVGDSVAFTTTADAPTATFDGPLEAALRLLVGRLGPKFTPDGLTVTGNVSLDELRAVFPGF